MCLAAGMDDYMTKPIHVQELVTALLKTKPRTGGVESKMAEDTLDETTYAQLEGAMGADFIGELIDTFLEDSPQLLAELKRASAANDLDALRRAAHTLKSNSANFGAMNLSHQAKELEQMARDGKLDGADDKISLLELEYARVEQALKAKQKT
jgi:HPt (histidine-containing phosphotransfer) domain-containing protein